MPVDRMLALQVTPPQFPWLGNSLPVGIVFLLHVAVAEFSVGAITLAVIMEWRALATGDVRPWRYAHSAVNSFYFVFSIGATLAVFAVVLLFGLWGNAFGQLANVLLPLLALAFGLFFLIAPLLTVYRNSWQRFSPRTHAILGTVVAGLMTLFVFLIVGLDAYLITPFNGGLWDATLNAAYWPLLVHGLIGNVSWTALFLAAYAAVRLRRTADPGERAFQGWAAHLNLRIGLGLALLMPIEGLILSYVLQNAQPGFFTNLVSGNSAWLMVVQEVFVGVILVGGNIALWLESPVNERRNRFAAAATLVSLAGMVVASLPDSVLPPAWEDARFIGIGVGIVATALHLWRRWRPPVWEPTASAKSQPRPSRMLRPVLVLVGSFALLTSLLMGVIKESARGDYAVYGVLTQAQAHERFTPRAELYP